MIGELRIAVIGAGAFGEEHLRVYAVLPGVEPVAVVDRNHARAQHLAKRYGVPHWFTDATQMLARCSPDAVSIVTPDATHVALTVEALDAGCAVLVEKPVAQTALEARTLEEAAGPGVVIPGHPLRFSEPYRHLRECVRRGELGKVIGVSASRDRSVDHHRQYQHSHPLFLTAIHDIDLAIWLTGAKVGRVSALVAHRDAEPPASLSFIQAVADDGSVWSIRSSWLLPDDEAVMDRLEVYGRDGVAQVELNPTGGRVRTGSQDVTTGPVHQVHAAALRGEIEHFCDCARRRVRSDVARLDEACHAVAVAEAALVSAGKHGAAVEL